jgi:protein-tyrosine phosphatase
MMWSDRQPTLRSAVPHVIDTHCHLLPGVDDGPRTVAAAVELARALGDQGVGTVVCTPHWSLAFPTGHADAAVACESLRAELSRCSLPLELVVAAEIHDGIAATRSFDELRERSIAGRWVVVEQVYDSLPNLAEAIVRRLEPEGLAAILAHPDRSRAVQRDLGVLDGARAAGAVLQVVVPSLLGEWGSLVQRTAWALIETERATLLASGAHGAAARSCRFVDVEPIVVVRFGRTKWEELTFREPNSLLSRPRRDGSSTSVSAR